MKKILYTDFEGVGEVIADLLENKDIKKAITRSNLYRFWKSIVGPKFAEKSKPFSMIGGGVMVIACENTVVAQELTFQKKMLITKFAPYLKSLKITLKDLKFDSKRWHVDSEEE